MYLMPVKKRPKWLRVNRVLGELGGRRDDRRGRLAYEGYIEGVGDDTMRRRGGKDLRRSGIGYEGVGV